jgi:hypothetical protein
LYRSGHITPASRKSRHIGDFAKLAAIDQSIDPAILM